MEDVKSLPLQAIDRYTILNHISSMENDAFDILWKCAKNIGDRCYDQYWSESLSFNDNLKYLGIHNVYGMAPALEASMSSWAVMDRETLNVYMNNAMISKVKDVADLKKMQITEKTVREKILGHEAFHLIEEIMEENTELQIKFQYPEYTDNDLEPFRDVAAHTFSNNILRTVKCEWIDLIWMEKYAPQHYQKTISMIREECIRLQNERYQ